MTSIPRSTAVDTILVVVDVQEKLLAKVPTADALVGSIGFMLDAAALFDVPARATEQYPKGLGRTTGELARRLPPQLPEIQAGDVVSNESKTTSGDRSMIR